MCGQAFSSSLLLMQYHELSYCSIAIICLLSYSNAFFSFQKPERCRVLSRPPETKGQNSDDRYRVSKGDYSYTRLDCKQRLIQNFYFLIYKRERFPTDFVIYWMLFRESKHGSQMTVREETLATRCTDIDYYEDV